MTAEEARKISGESNTIDSLCMDYIYRNIDYDIKAAAEENQTSCHSTIGGCDKSWEQIDEERHLIKEHFSALGFTVECLGYNRACMWDEYRISW